MCTKPEDPHSKASFKIVKMIFAVHTPSNNDFKKQEIRSRFLPSSHGGAKLRPPSLESVLQGDSKDLRETEVCFAAGVATWFLKTATSLAKGV